MSPKMFSRLMRVIKYIVSEKTLAHQARKPTGLLGKYILQPMFVHGNAALNAFMLEKLDVKPTDCILEIGFGPGVMLGDLSERIEDGKVHGIDFSKTMIEQATIRNQPHIESGCLRLCEGCSDKMPYEDNHFDKIVTGNTLYFWHPPEPHLKEILRVLKPGGLFVMGFRDKAQIDQMQLSQEVFLRYTQQDVVALLESIGFTDVSVAVQGSMPVDSYVAIATKLD